MKDIANLPVIFDYRWEGTHGIGRFTREIGKRLQGYNLQGPSPLSPLGMLYIRIVSNVSTIIQQA